MTYPQTMIISRIAPGRNPRTYFDPAEMAEMENSVREQGVIQPILIRPVGDNFQIVAGERRYRAAKSALGDQYEMPVLIKEMTDDEADEMALIENVQRSQMSPTEEAQAAARILGRCAGNHDEAAKRLGWSRGTLDKRLALMNCSESVRAALNERKIQLGHAELLASTEKTVQDKALDAILKNNLTVAAVKQQLSSIAKDLSTAIFDKSECAGCAFNSSNQAALFGESVNAGFCTRASCYDQKTEEELARRRDALVDEFPRVEIVRPGDQFTIVKLQATGEMGVGEEQAKACRACKNFGAVVSAVPGKVGKVYKDQCFDTACNARMIAKRIKAEQAEAGATAEAKAAIAADGKPVTAAAPKQPGTAKGVSKSDSTSASVTVQDSNRIKEYRVGVWRTAIKKDLLANPGQNLSVMLALAATGNFRHVSSTKMREGLAKLSGIDSINVSLDDAIPAAVGLSDDDRKLMTLGITCSAMNDIEERNLVEIMKFVKVDLKAHWKLCSEFFALLTKSEIEVVCEEVGLKKALGDKYAKTMLLKKDEIIKALLAVEGFEYNGLVPRSMQFDLA